MAQKMEDGSPGQEPFTSRGGFQLMGTFRLSVNRKPSPRTRPPSLHPVS